MKNMFGKHKKRSIKQNKEQESLYLLQKQLDRLEKELQDSKNIYLTTLKELKKTESQKQEEPLKQEEIKELEEIETINHEETEPLFNEEEYVFLSKPPSTRKKAIKLLEEEAVKEIKTNRREIIKQKIEDELKKKELSAKELKILFVDEYEYCSKATFYRYLEALRKEQRIDSIKINGKEYLCSIPSHAHQNSTF